MRGGQFDAFESQGEGTVKNLVVAMTLIFGGCASGTLPFGQGPKLSESECAASCKAHDEQCPKVFAAFPERGAVECPAGHKICMQSCASRHAAASAAAAPSAERTASPKEAKLRELKQLYERGLVSDDVYKERQRAILSE